VSATKHIEQHSSTVKHVRAAGIVLLCSLLTSACSVVSTTDSAIEESKLVDQSVTRNVEPQGVASADAEVIKTVVADAEADGNANLLAWSNPDTGSKGTITAINKFTGSHGQKCKKFQTTVDTFMGISIYNGETCELRRGFWVLSWFLRDEG
jgi:surface antigen